MRNPAFFVLTALLCLVSGAVSGQDAEPVDVGTREEVKVKLIQVDALVLGKDGMTVPDLTKEDFELKVGDQALDIDTLDVVCPIGAAPDPVAINDPKNLPARIGPGLKRKIVFVIDYYFIPVTMRPQVLDAAQAMINLASTDEEEIMIVALAYGVRVEQRFTSDKKQVINALRRMEHDVTLWAREFGTGASGKEYFSDLTTLMDVVDGYDGSKAVVLFSALTGLANTSDNWFNDVTMHAASARVAVYPSFAAGLQPGASASVSEALARLANQTGGRMPFYTGDLSVPYRRAQRDLSCRYTVGAYIDEEEGRQRRTVHVRVNKEGLETRHPEMIKLFTDEQKRASRTQAAFIDPTPYENPLVRAFAFPAHPVSKNQWDTLVTAQFSMPLHDGPAGVDVNAAIMRDNRKVEKYKSQFQIEAAPGGPTDSRPVTIMGDTTLKSGQHQLTVVLSETGGRDIVSAASDFTVPDVLTDTLILRGPLLARVVPGGMLIRADEEERPGDTKLDEVVGDGSFEPLLLHKIGTGDELLFYWNACVYGKSRLKPGLVVKRSVHDENGKVAHEMDPIPLKLEEVGKKLVCHDQLETVPAGTLDSGEYDIDVSIVYGNSGDLMGRGRAPLMVD